MLSTCSLFLRISIINTFLERNIYCGYYMKKKKNHVIDILRENRKLNQHRFFFKHQVSCVNSFLTGNARKQSGAL